MFMGVDGTIIADETKREKEKDRNKESFKWNEFEVCKFSLNNKVFFLGVRLKFSFPTVLTVCPYLPNKLIIIFWGQFKP